MELKCLHWIALYVKRSCTCVGSDHVAYSPDTMDNASYFVDLTF